MICSKKNNSFIKRELWHAFGEELGGEQVKRGLEPGKIILKEGKYLIIIDTYTAAIWTMYIACTRVQVHFISRDNLHLVIYNKDLLSNIYSIFGGQRINTGYRLIDKNYIIKGNSKAKIRVLFSSRSVRKLILAQPSVYLQICGCPVCSDAYASRNINKLYYESAGIINDVDRLRKIVLLIKEILNLLQIMGSIVEEPLDIPLEYLLSNKLLQ